VLENIPKNRLITYLLVLGAIPIVFVTMNFLGERRQISETQSQIENLKDRAFILDRRQSQNNAARENFKDSDHYFLDKHLETLKFLEPEVDGLHKLESNKNYAGDENVKQRLEFLTGNANTLQFSEGNVQSFQYVQEISDTLVHPVEVNVSDLKKILSLIEGVEIPPNSPPTDRPQLIILDFRIDKKEINSNNEVFLLNLKLLKREYNP
jgi:hypothetical protein